MALSDDEIKHVAKLARLAVSDAEVPDYVGKLSRIIDLVQQLDAVDTSGVTPMAHPLEMAQRLRADDVTEENCRDAYQASAPDVVDGLYRVPRVIE